MPEKDQLATMLIENMRRSDLTPYEEARGLQLMLDFGESVSRIAEKTGFSKTKIRNRIKLSRFDEELMKKSQAYQPTLEQYLKLSEIEDTDIANECLREIGSKNFDNKVANAIRQQKEKKDREVVREIITKYAEKLEDSSYDAIHGHYVAVESIYGECSEERIQKALEKHGKLYWSEGYGFTIYRAYGVEDDTAKEELNGKRRKRDALEHKSNKLWEDMIDRAEAWVKGYVPHKGHFEILTEAFVDAYVSHKCSTNNFWSMVEDMGGEIPENRWEDRQRDIAVCSVVMEKYDKSREKTMLMILWNMFPASNPARLYYKSTKLEHHYSGASWLWDLLDKLGYNTGDDEWNFITGHHSIYSEEVPL
jgi:ParB family chromosome partitioning protein